jgi:hypothetical protein
LTGGIPSACQGTIENPGAASGNLCVFEQTAENVLEITPLSMSTGGLGAGRAGALLWIKAKTAAKEVDASGTWALTG